LFSRLKPAVHFLSLVLLSMLALQLFFFMKILLMNVLTTESTSFQRSEAWRIVQRDGGLPWRQTWVSQENIATAVKKAVIASEDGDFVNHAGVEWDAIESAWNKNSQAKARAERRAATASAKSGSSVSSKSTSTPRTPKVIGGSTISQQLAKNIFLSGERTFIRKGQEFIITHFLELLLSKQQILTIYLNNVEWGEGVFGIEGAAQHYFSKPAKQLSDYESARLAVMLPRPKYFEKLSNSSYLSARASSIVSRMRDAELP
jgi:monofunctional biosynthetic peptidoglycan transglycosylase